MRVRVDIVPRIFVVEDIDFTRMTGIIGFRQDDKRVDNSAKDRGDVFRDSTCHNHASVVDFGD